MDISGECDAAVDIMMSDTTTVRQAMMATREAAYHANGKLGVGPVGARWDGTESNKYITHAAIHNGRGTCMIKRWQEFGETVTGNGTTGVATEVTLHSELPRLIRVMVHGQTVRVNTTGEGNERIDSIMTRAVRDLGLPEEVTSRMWPHRGITDKDGETQETTQT